MIEDGEYRVLGILDTETQHWPQTKTAQVYNYVGRITGLSTSEFRLTFGVALNARCTRFIVSFKSFDHALALELACGDDADEKAGEDDVWTAEWQSEKRFCEFFSRNG